MFDPWILYSRHNDVNSFVARYLCTNFRFAKVGILRLAEGLNVAKQERRSPTGFSSTLYIAISCNGFSIFSVDTPGPCLHRYDLFKKLNYLREGLSIWEHSNRDTKGFQHHKDTVFGLKGMPNYENKTKIQSSVETVHKLDFGIYGQIFRGCGTR
jgi:hypothetical protein